ncbi:MAG: PIN domain-containing protein [Patescibacteria group bacterium]|nr:PIN domain-containing protein [Patescibacteria group bacterium]
MAKIQVFIDTDVIISSLSSRTGASFAVINNSRIKKIISKTVRKEVVEVTARLSVEKKKTQIIFKKINTISSNLSKKEILEDYGKYVSDQEDSHVVAGADRPKSRFLLTHNIKHYKVNKINSGLGIIVLKPGNLLQYLRSLGKF